VFCTLALHTLAQARERILQRLNETSDGAALAELLSDEATDASDAPRRALRRRSGSVTTLVAGLEPARQGTVAMEQGVDFDATHVAPSVGWITGLSGADTRRRQHKWRLYAIAPISSSLWPTRIGPRLALTRRCHKACQHIR
jgi:hypothetical protein